MLGSFGLLSSWAGRVFANITHGAEMSNQIRVVIRLAVQLLLMVIFTITQWDFGALIVHSPRGGIGQQKNVCVKQYSLECYNIL